MNAAAKERKVSITKDAELEREALAIDKQLKSMSGKTFNSQNLQTTNKFMHHSLHRHMIISTKNVHASRDFYGFLKRYKLEQNEVKEHDNLYQEMVSELVCIFV